MIWPLWMVSLLQWVADNRVGDIASILGIAISLIGFIVTAINIGRSRSAADRAEQAAHAARTSIRFYDSISEISSAISIMEEIRRIHREGRSESLLDRYATLRRLLIGIRERNPNLTEPQKAKIQQATVTMKGLEKALDLARSKKLEPDLVKKNHLVSDRIEELQTILVELQTQASGIQNG